MKKTVLLFMFFCMCFVLINDLQGSEVKIDFSLLSGGRFLDDDMYTTAPGIDGSIHWVSQLPSLQSGVSSSYYHIAYLIDGEHDGIQTNYWLANSPKSSGNPPDYLRIEFPAPVYLTRVRTYNVAWIGPTSDPGRLRWMESLLWISDNGVDYTQVATSPSTVHLMKTITSILQSTTGLHIWSTGHTKTASTNPTTTVWAK